MSIISEREQRIFPVPPPYSAAPIRSDKLRRRARRWLAIKRRDDLTVRELAAQLGERTSTVAAAIHWAEEERSRRGDREYERLRSPVVHKASGLTEDDVLYLLTEYPPGTAVGDHPAFWPFLGPLVEKILGPLDPAEAELVAAEAA